MRIYWIDILGRGKLGMMPRPKGDYWMESEIWKLKRAKVNTVVSLLEQRESLALGIQQEEKLCEKYGIHFINFPIKDRGTPEDTTSFFQLVDLINDRLTNGENVVVHCRMGIGRTALVSAAILIKNGYPIENIFAFLSEKRTLSVPDTEEQKEWIIHHVRR